MAESNANETAAEEEGPAYSVQLAPDEVPSFIDRLMTHLRDENEPETFLFEGTEIETATRDVRSVELHVYLPGEDPAVPAPQRDVTPDSEAFRELERRAALVATSFAQSWGASRAHVVDAGPNGEPVSRLDAVLRAEYRASADWWERDDHLFALSTGWIAGSMATAFAQTLFVMPRGSESSASLIERAYTFQTSEGNTEAVTGTNTRSLGDEFLNYFFDHGEEATAYRVTDSATQEYVIVDPPRGIVTRADLTRTQFLRRDPAASWASYVRVFFDGGYDHLDEYEGWVDDESSLEPARELDGSTDTGLDAAAIEAITAGPGVDSAIMHAIGQSWADAGADDETGDYCVFFESSSSDEYAEERDALLALLSMLGYQPDERPASAESGEVWVRYDDRLRSEIDQWA